MCQYSLQQDHYTRNARFRRFLDVPYPRFLSNYPFVKQSWVSRHCGIEVGLGEEAAPPSPEREPVVKKYPDLNPQKKDLVIVVRSVPVETSRPALDQSRSRRPGSFRRQREALTPTTASLGAYCRLFFRAFGPPFSYLKKRAPSSVSNKTDSRGTLPMDKTD